MKRNGNAGEITEALEEEKMYKQKLHVTYFSAVGSQTSVQVINLERPREAFRENVKYVS